MVTLLSVLFIMIVLLVILIIKNEINYKIRMRWIDEINRSQVSGDASLKWGHLPSGDRTFYDPFLWKYKLLKEYLKIS